MSQLPEAGGVVADAVQRARSDAPETASAPRTWADLKARKSSVPEGLWLRCPGDECGQMIYRKQMEANLHVCPECGHHFRIGAAERVRQLADQGSFEPMFAGLLP